MSRALDAVVGIRLLKLLSTPIQKSKAFQLGIIDADGKKLKNPSTTAERNAYTLLNRFVFKVQKSLTRSSDMNARRLLSFAAAMALLREYEETDDELDVAVLLELHMEDETVQQQARLLESNVLSLKNYMEEMNGVAGGAVAGIGVGPQGEPGRDPVFMPMNRRKKKKKNANSK
jgi:hypothetical protein|tara:strand:- start:20982 stop:21503 length:522 start_codon:yes stop_codon:yes gene_type:complete